MYDAQQLKYAKSLHPNIRWTLCTVHACRCMYVTKESTCRESKLKPNFLLFPMKNWAHHFAKRSRSLFENELTFLSWKWAQLFILKMSSAFYLENELSFLSWKWADFFLKKGPFLLLKGHILFLKKTTSSLEKSLLLCVKKEPTLFLKNPLCLWNSLFFFKAEPTSFKN
jgi:hypothetical protein